MLTRRRPASWVTSSMASRVVSSRRAIRSIGRGPRDRGPHSGALRKHARNLRAPRAYNRRMSRLPKEPPGAEITPEALYQRRRDFLKNTALFAGTAAALGTGLL